MCDKCVAKARQNAAADALERACLAQLHSGGPVRAKRPMIVGERPSELFLPRRRRAVGH